MSIGDVPGTTPSSDAQAAGGVKRVLRPLVAVVVGIAVWLTVFYVSRAVLPGPSAARSWSAASGAPVPSEFVFMMFPVDDATPVFDAPGGQQVGVLERALGNDYGELKSRQWIQVPGGGPGGKNAFVRASDLRYLSPIVAGTAKPVDGAPAQRVNYVANFAKSFMARAPEESRAATFMVYTSRPDSLEREAEAAEKGDQTGWRYVSLTLRVGANRRQYYAKVSANDAVPLAVDQISDGTRLQSKLMRNIIAGCLATLIAGFVTMAAWVRVRLI